MTTEAQIANGLNAAITIIGDPEICRVMNEDALSFLDKYLPRAPEYDYLKQVAAEVKPSPAPFRFPPSKLTILSS